MQDGNTSKRTRKLRASKRASGQLDREIAKNNISEACSWEREGNYNFETLPLISIALTLKEIMIGVTSPLMKLEL